MKYESLRDRIARLERVQEQLIDALRRGYTAVGIDEDWDFIIPLRGQFAGVWLARDEVVAGTADHDDGSRVFLKKSEVSE